MRLVLRLMNLTTAKPLECKVDYPLDTRGYKHGTISSQSYRGNDLATEYYHGFPIYSKEYEIYWAYL